jgi:hypothetical protein
MSDERNIDDIDDDHPAIRWAFLEGYKACCGDIRDRPFVRWGYSWIERKLADHAFNKWLEGD